MDRVPVNSSNLRSVGYDSISKILEVEFHTGTVYQYFDVPDAIHQGLMSASSHGRYFYYTVRYKFRYRRIR